MSLNDDRADDGDTGDSDGSEIFNDAVSVSRGIIRDVFQATTAAAKLDQADRDGLKVSPDERAALRSDVQQVAVRLRFEIEQAADSGDHWAREIIDRWDDGLLHRLERKQMRGDDYAQLARDITTAGIELGYTNVRYDSNENSNSHSPDDGEIMEIIESMR